MVSRRTATCHGMGVCLSCTDRRRSEEFYTGILGFELVRGDGEPGVCRWYRLGDLTVSVMPNATRPMPTGFYPEQATFLLMIETDDLPGIHQRCEEAGVPINFYDGDVVMEIEDPDGLPIEIFQKTDD